MTRLKGALLASALLLMGGSVSAENGVKPQYGGQLEIGTVYVTLSALSWDPADFNWKLNHDTGLFYEQLFAGDLSKSKKAGGALQLHSRRLAADRRHPRRAGREVGMEAGPAARRDEGAQGRHVPREARRHEEARAHRRGHRLQLQPAEHEPQEAAGLFRPRRSRRGRRQPYRRLLHEALLRRMGLPLRLGLLLGDPSEGSGRCRRQQLEERQRHRPLYAERVHLRQLQRLRQEPRLLGQGEDRQHRIQAAVRRQDHLPHHQGRGDLHHRASYRQARHARGDPLAERRLA